MLARRSSASIAYRVGDHPFFGEPQGVPVQPFSLPPGRASGFQINSRTHSFSESPSSPHTLVFDFDHEDPAHFLSICVTGIDRADSIHV